MASSLTVELSPCRASFRCVLGLVLFWVASPTLATPVPDNRVILALVLAQESDITRQAEAPSVVFAKKDGKGRGSSGNSGLGNGKDKSGKKDKGGQETVESDAQDQPVDGDGATVVETGDAGSLVEDAVAEGDAQEQPVDDGPTVVETGDAGSLVEDAVADGGAQEQPVDDIATVVETGDAESLVEDAVADGDVEDQPVATLALSGIPPDRVTAADPYRFMPTVEYDGQSTLVFSITGLPLWASFDEVTGELSGTPSEADVGRYSAIMVSVTDGIAETRLPPFSIAVASATGSIRLRWTPPIENEDGSPLLDLAGYRIYWRSTSSTETGSMKIDNPGLSAIVIDNLIAGTYEFTMTSFNVQGIESSPSNSITRTVDASVGIGVAQGGSTAVETRSASIDEAAVAGTATGTGIAPRLMISGTPPEAVTAGQLYLFTPGFESSGEDPPVFMVEGLPHWAGFNTINGEIYGAPAEEDIGTYDAITVSATDGVVETSLPAFSIEVVAPGAAQGAVTLSWMPPTENEDGSYLVDLAGYWIYWGNNPGQYTEWLRVDNPGLTTVVIEDLVPGDWEFAMTSFNAAGVESSLSNTVTRFVD